MNNLACYILAYIYVRVWLFLVKIQDDCQGLVVSKGKGIFCSFFIRYRNKKYIIQSLYSSITKSCKTHLTGVIDPLPHPIQSSSVWVFVVDSRSRYFSSNTFWVKVFFSHFARKLLVFAVVIVICACVCFFSALLLDVLKQCYGPQTFYNKIDIVTMHNYEDLSNFKSSELSTSYYPFLHSISLVKYQPAPT